MQQHATEPSHDAISWRDAMGFWLKLGFISFGGPAGQIALMHQELVERRRWISDKRFLHALNYCMLLPGPEAQQLATYLGWLMHRTAGGIMAGLLFVLPSLLLLVLLSWLYLAFGDMPLVEGLFYGIKPAVAAIVAHAAWRIGSRTLHNPLLWLVATASFGAILLAKVPFPWIVLAAAVVGLVGGKWLPQYFRPTGGHHAAAGVHLPAIIDDHTPIPAHARFCWSRLAAVVLVSMSLWGVSIGALSFFYGWQHDFTQMGWFFSKAALLTFGGAYAVLPYVYQGAVEQHGWVTAAQMMDGLALGETTPGPLIMVVAFVAYVGAYTKALLGPDLLFAAGASAAVLVTWFTFLPSFLFILAGGPLVESTRDDLHFTAPLMAITAAIVGVILKLALFFGYHAFWPAGFSGEFDAAAAILAALAAFALLRLQMNVVPVILASAVAGLLLRLMLG